MKLKGKIIYSLFIAVVSIVMSVSCAGGINDGDLTKTGLLDQNGNVISGTMIKTNTVYIKGAIPRWATNLRVSFTIKTNDGSFEIKYDEDVTVPNLPDSPTDYYKIFVPYSGFEYYKVSYKDTKKLSQLWLDQVFRRGSSDGKVFAIRNKANYRNHENFQKEENGRYDYYYFKENGDIVYKGGDNTHLSNETVVKRFVGAVIVDYRRVTDRTDWENNYEPDKIERTGEYTVGAIYKMAVNVNDARRRFANDGGVAPDGAYEFIAARKWIWFFNNDFVQDKVVFNRQYYNTDFIEVLVLNPHTREGALYCLGVDAYYYYPPEAYRNGEGTMPPINGFTEANMPYMTDERIYLGQRPEYILPLLTHTTTFTDASRNWKFLAMPGHPEPASSIAAGGTTERNTGGRLPRW